ncbi:MAG: response regulator [Sphingomonadales bacterium]
MTQTPSRLSTKRTRPGHSSGGAGFGWPLVGLVIAVSSSAAAWYLAVVAGQWQTSGVLAGVALASAALALVLLWRSGYAPPPGGDAGLLFSALDSAVNGRVITDRDGRVTYANARWRTMTGVFRGDPPSPVDLAEELGPLAQTAVGGGQGQETVFVDLGNRGRRWWRFAAGEAGDAVAWQVSDLSADGSVQAVARAGRRLHGDVLDRAGFGLLMVGGDGRIIHINDRLAGWLGVDAGKTAGSPLSVVAPALNLSGLGPDLEPGRTMILRPTEGGTTAVRVVFAEMEDGADGQTQNMVVVLGRPDSAGDDTAQDAATPGRPASLAVPDMRFERYFAEAPVGIATVDGKGLVLECNQVFQSLFRDAFRGDQLLLGDVLAPEDSRDALRGIAEALETGREPHPLDVGFTSPANRQAQLFIHRMNPVEGEDDRAIIYLIDTTDQKNLEMQFAQSQKMQAVGQLAGGVAHDFNNLLTAISGFCDLLLVRHGPGDHSFADIMQIRQNANRAANLVRQLLAFSRQQTLRPTVLLVTDVLAELSNLIRRLIGEDIELKMIHGRNLGPVKVDQGQLEQVIINLAVNARDAMPDGGTLIIRTANVSRAESKALDHTMMPEGDYILLEVADTGTGIPKEHIGKIFEPFFSTKEVGKGTGLGLSTVYGIVKQTGGFIFPVSEPGSGAVFRIYLPVHHEAIAAPAPRQPERKSRDLTGKGTVLLVEDEDAVRTFASRALMNKGYQVFEADSGEAALRLVDEHEGDIDLLISDVVMPLMDGPTLVREIQARRHDMKIIFISGYAEDAFRKNMDQNAVFSFLPKPFSLKQLAEKVKEVLEAE